MTDKYTITTHPTLMVIAAIAHYNRRSYLPTSKELYDILTPLITPDQLKKTIKELIYWGAIVRRLKGASPDFNITYEIGGYSHGTASATYERYWEEIIMEKLIIEEEEKNVLLG